MTALARAVAPVAAVPRVWPARAMLAVILAVQTAFTLGLENTAFQDEALYLYVGRLDDGDRLAYHATYFSGTPRLYPALAAWVDGWAGLEGARAISLAAMLGTTALLYSFTARLFDHHAGVAAAACYAVLESTLTLGRLATYDASSVFLLALAAWLAVLPRRTGPLLAGPVCALAFAVKYASALYLPVIAGLAVLAAVPRLGWPRSLLRGVLLVPPALAGGAALLVYGGVLQGFAATTLARPRGSETPPQVLLAAGKYIGFFLLLGVLGAVHLVRGAGPDLGSRTRRAALALLLVAAGCLAPAFQARGHTWVALHKHVGYGALFTAPLVGLGVRRLVGRHLRNVQFGIAAWIGLFVIGTTQARAVFDDWPDSTTLIRLLEAETRPGERYLASVPQIPIYYLGRDRTSEGQWASTYNFKRPAAIGEAEYDMIILDSGIATEVNAVIERELARSPDYRFRVRLRYDRGHLHGQYVIWVRR